MRARTLLCVFVLLLIPFSAEAKRRAVNPGGRDCSYGVIDHPEWANWVAVDASDVYYYDEFDFTVYRVAKGGGVRTPLAFVYGLLILDLTVDDANVYLATIPEDDLATIPLPGSILAVPKSGGAYRTVVSGVTFPSQIAADATHIYWAAIGTVNFDTGVALSDGKVERVRKDGSGRETLAANLSEPLSIVLDETDVYFSELGLAQGNPSAGVRKIAKSGGTVVHVQDQYLAADLAESDGQIVYFGATRDTQRAGMLRVAKSGGTSQWIVEDNEILGGPRVFDGQLYYVTTRSDADALMRVPVSGGTPAFLTIRT